jgi:hypothetical protein
LNQSRFWPQAHAPPPLKLLGPMHLGGSGARLRALAPVCLIPSGIPSPSPSASPLKLGPGSLPASDPSPQVVFGRPSVEPSICPSAFPSSPDLNCGYMPQADRAPVVTPASVCHITTPRTMPDPSTGPRPGSIPSTEPLNIKPSSTSGTSVPWDGHDRPLYRLSEGPKLEPLGRPSVGPSVIPIPRA